jgi:hypothetical protein
MHSRQLFKDYESPAVKPKTKKLTAIKPKGEREQSKYLLASSKMWVRNKFG